MVSFARQPEQSMLRTTCDVVTPSPSVTRNTSYLRDAMATSGPRTDGRRYQAGRGSQMLASDVPKNRPSAESDAGTGVAQAHNRGGTVSCRVQALDSVSAFVYHASMLVSEQSTARANVTWPELHSVEGWALERTEVWVRLMRWVTEVIVVQRFSTSKVLIDPAACLFVEPVDS